MGSSRRVGALLGLVGLAGYLLHCGPTVLNPQPCLPDAPSSDPRSCNYNDGFAGSSNAGGAGNVAGSSSAGAASGLAGAGGAFASAGASAGGVSGFAGAFNPEAGAAGSSIGEGGEAGSGQAGALGLDSN
jgi:hypothetical protein